jgi:rhodanese-related sulfurtransferase
LRRVCDSRSQDRRWFEQAADVVELKLYPVEKFAGRDTVLYCSCPNDASARAAGVRILRSRGHVNPKALRGGLDAWTQAALRGGKGRCESFSGRLAGSKCHRPRPP